MKNLCLLVFIFCSVCFGEEYVDSSSIMKDGSLWKYITINAFGYNSENVRQDSVMYYQTHLDSIIKYRCGDGFNVASLNDYNTTNFEFLEHLTFNIMVNDNLWATRSNYASFVNMLFSIPNTSFVDTVVGYNTNTFLIRNLVIDPFHFSPGYVDGVVIPFKHYLSSFSQTTSINFSCVSIQKYKVNHDTITNNVFDTLSFIDTIKISIKDTITKHDTINITKIDTIKVQKNDTVFINDTITLKDTIKTIQHDTIINKVFDTLHFIDTVKIISHDTLNTCKIGQFQKYSEKLYISKGQSTVSNPITIDEKFGNSPCIEVETNEDVNVEVYVYDNLGVAVASGLYTIKQSTQKQYISFNGYSKNGSKVSNGVYLIRVISEHNNMISNNLYRVGIVN